MHRYLIETNDFETTCTFASKAELIQSLECDDAGSAAAITVVEFDTDEGTARDVTTDIAREMVDATEWNWSEGRDADYRDTDLCAFILLHAEIYAGEVFAELKREAA
jgi:hypothetical protein